MDESIRNGRVLILDFKCSSQGEVILLNLSHLDKSSFITRFGGIGVNDDVNSTGNTVTARQDSPMCRSYWHCSQVEHRWICPREQNQATFRLRSVVDDGRERSRQSVVKRAYQE